MSSEFWEAQSDCINDGTPYDINTFNTSWWCHRC